MDYSVLLVLEQVTKPVKEGRNLMKAGNQVIHIGIIDYLQGWSLLKKAEGLFKANHNNISAINPKLYE